MSVWVPGKTVDDYRLQERLGAGGAGEVWRVEHLPTGAQRALKVLHADGVESIERFQREALALAELEHPNVAKVHTAGEVDGQPYLVLDLAAGGDLATRLKQGPLAPEAARELMRALASGLAHVHDRGLLHRDLKPDNVLFDEEDRPLLVDFGLARRIEGSSLTQTGAVLGTPKYMAPEQANGSKQLDERTDVYGLGAVLYHALTGQPPFSGSMVLAVLHDVLKKPPRPLQELNPAVPADLAAVCLKALSKERMQRFPTARAFAAALDGPPPGSRSLGPALVFAALAALCGVGALGGVYAVSRGEGTPPVVPPKPVAEQAVDPPPAHEVPVEVAAVDAPELDRVLGALPLVTEADLTGFTWSEYTGTAAQFLAGTHMGALTKVSRWLIDARSFHHAVALLYQVATRGRELSDPAARKGSQRAWVRLGEVLSSDFRASGNLWTDAEWARVRQEVVSDCYERSIAGGQADGALALAVLHIEPGPAARMGFDLNPGEAYRRFATALELSVPGAHEHLVAKGWLAKLACDHPEIPGRIGDDLALEYAEHTLQLTKPGHPNRPEVQRVFDALEARVAAGGAESELDRVLAALTPLTLDDLEGFDWTPYFCEPEELFDGRNATPLGPVRRWLLGAGRDAEALALIYQVGTRGKGVPDEERKRLSQEAWFMLGEGLRKDPRLRAAVWDEEAWVHVRRAVVLECYRRAASAGRSDGALALGLLYLGESEAEIGLAPDLAEAQRWFFAVLEAVVRVDGDQELAELKLARLAFEHPDLSGRLPDEQALRYAARAQQFMGSYRQEEAKTVYDGIKARIDAVAGE